MQYCYTVSIRRFSFTYRHDFQIATNSHRIDAIYMSILKQLDVIRHDKHKERVVKRYLLESCSKLSRFRSDASFKKNMKIATLFLKGVATKKQMHQAEWEIEGAAFGTEHYSEAGVRVYSRARPNLHKDLIQVRISTGLTNTEARAHLIQMAYFIDHVFCHIHLKENWLFDDEAEKFLCPRLFKRYFGESYK